MRDIKPMLATDLEGFTTEVIRQIVSAAKKEGFRLSAPIQFEKIPVRDSEGVIYEINYEVSDYTEDYGSSTEEINHDAA